MNVIARLEFEFVAVQSVSNYVTENPSSFVLLRFMLDYFLTIQSSRRVDAGLLNQIKTLRANNQCYTTLEIANISRMHKCTQLFHCLLE